MNPKRLRTAWRSIGKGLVACSLVLLTCLPLAGCLTTPPYPDDVVVQGQFPNAVPSTDLSSLQSMKYGNFWEDCSLLFGGTFGVAVDTSAHTASMYVSSSNGHAGFYGTLNGSTGMGPNEFYGSGTLQGNPGPGLSSATFACKAYDTDQTCGLIACNLSISLVGTVYTFPAGILPATEEGFCTTTWNN